MRTFTICSLSNVLFPLLWWSLHFPIELWPVLSSSAPSMVCTCVQLRGNLSCFSPKRKEIVLSRGKILQSEEHPITLNDHSVFYFWPPIALWFWEHSSIKALTPPTSVTGRHGHGWVRALSCPYPCELCSPLIRASSLPSCWRVTGVSWELAKSP